MKKYLLQFLAVALLLVAVSAKQAFALSVPTQLVASSSSYSTYQLGSFTATGTSNANGGGTLTAWGNNGYGQLGRGSYATADAIAIKVIQPVGTTGWVSAAGGWDFALGIAVTSTDSAVYTWGHNQYGQLGTTINSGTDTPNPVPLKVTLPAMPKFVAAGFASSYALTTDGNIYSWGYNSWGQLGQTTNSGTSTPTPTPAAAYLAPYYGYDTLAVGYGHAIAIGTDILLTVPDKSEKSRHPMGSVIKVYTFGLNQYGQLGTTTYSGTTTANPTPTPISVGGSYTPSSVAAGLNHSLVLLSDGSLRTFGSNQYGQLGSRINSGTTTPNPTSVSALKPTGATGWKQIAAGGYHSAAIDSTGKLYTWGWNYYGQLGNSTNVGTNTANFTPTQVTLPNGDTATSVSAGVWHTSVYCKSGNTYTFGLNNVGQLGNQTNIGTVNPNASPLTVGNSTLSLPYSQNFESSWASPADLADWTSYSNPSSSTMPNLNNAWQREDSLSTLYWSTPTYGAYTPTGANGTTHSVRYHGSFTTPTTTGSLLSPQFALTGTTTVSYYTTNTNGTADTLFLAWSADGGVTFTNLDTATAKASGWQLRNVVFSSTSSTVKFRFTASSIRYYADIGVDEFSVIAGFLPVELTAFDAKVQNGAALRTWQTATEKNNAGFDIERSADNQTFTKIGFVQGHGTTTQAQSYSFADNATLAGKSVFYRLKQTDYDGKFSYSKTVEVKLGVPKVFALSQNYPNPFNPSTTINYQLPVSGLVTIKLYDVLGREIQTLVNERKDAGSYNVTLNASKLASGIYLYQLQSGSFVQTKKMLLVK
jgi:alpha-tubulin suppressor-like RCC1 family protein